MRLTLWSAVENINIDKGTIPIKFTAKSTLLTSLGAQRDKTGWTIAQMRERIKVLDILHEAKDDSEIELTKEQLMFLSESLNNTQFVFALDNTLILADKITELINS